MQTVPFPSTQRPRILVQVSLECDIMTSAVRTSILYARFIWIDVNISKHTELNPPTVAPVCLSTAVSTWQPDAEPACVLSTASQVGKR